MRNMVDAVIELLRARPAEDIRIRDVAKESGHHHRFVQAWFGGKVGLFRAAFEQLTITEAQQVRGPGNTPGVMRPDLLVLVGLMNWLVAAEPGCLDGPRATPILDRSIAVYSEEYGLPAKMARLMAMRAISSAISAVLFAGPLGMDEDDIIELTALEAQLVQLLADSEPTEP